MPGENLELWRKTTWRAVLEGIADDKLIASKFLGFALSSHKDAMTLDGLDEHAQLVEQARVHDELEAAIRRRADTLPELNRAGLLKMLRDLPIKCPRGI